MFGSQSLLTTLAIYSVEILLFTYKRKPINRRGLKTNYRMYLASQIARTKENSVVSASSKSAAMIYDCRVSFLQIFSGAKDALCDAALGKVKCSSLALGPFILLIERSPADFWLFILALMFLVRAVVLREACGFENFKVKAAFLFGLYVCCLQQARHACLLHGRDRGLV